MEAGQLPGLEDGLSRDLLLGGAGPNGGGPIDPDVLADAEAFLRPGRRRRVGGRVVTQEEMRKAAVALAAYRRASGRSPSLGPWLSQLVMRVRDYPSWDADIFRRVVESAWRLRWWERRSSRSPSPAVIFGNQRCFDRVVEDARREAAGQVRPRVYGREVIT